MVSEKGDIPDREEVFPDHAGRGAFLAELLNRGETIVHLSDGSTHELHGHDTYVMNGTEALEPPIVYTQNEDDEEVWFYPDEIVSLVQH